MDRQRRDAVALFYADSVEHTFIRLSLDFAAPRKYVIATGFHSDNVHWSPDGNLLLAGQVGGLAEIVDYMTGAPGAQHGNARVVRIGPRTMEMTDVVDASDFPLASGAVHSATTSGWAGSQEPSDVPPSPRHF